MQAFVARAATLLVHHPLVGNVRPRDELRIISENKLAPTKLFAKCVCWRAERTFQSRRVVSFLSRTNHRVCLIKTHFEGI